MMSLTRALNTEPVRVPLSGGCEEAVYVTYSYCSSRKAIGLANVTKTRGSITYEYNQDAMHFNFVCMCKGGTDRNVDTVLETCQLNIKFAS